MGAEPAVPIPRSLLVRLFEEAASAAPGEACGLLLGRRAPVEVHDAAPATNAGPAGRFLIPAADLLRARDVAIAAGWEVLGPWHSHPGGDAAPSPADHASAVAWPGALWLVLGREARLFQACEGGLRPRAIRPSGRGHVLQSAAP